MSNERIVSPEPVGCLTPGRPDEQTRSFTYIDDCVRGTLLIMHSDVVEPINLGSDEMVTIKQLADMVEEIAGLNVERRYMLDAPDGVRGRSSENTMIRERLRWTPSCSWRSASRSPTMGVRPGRR